MGNRSNINFVTEHRDNGDVVGLNVYTHWGGRSAQLEALFAADEQIAQGERLDKAFFVRRVARAATDGMDGLYGAGFKPFVVSSAKGAYSYISDSQHVVLTFDLVRELVVIADDSFSEAPSIHGTYALDHEGIIQAQEALIPQCDPESHCDGCAKRAAYEAKGLSRVEAEMAVERESFSPAFPLISALASVPRSDLGEPA